MQKKSSLTFVIAVMPEAASQYPKLDITLPTRSGSVLSSQKTLSIESNSTLSASVSAAKREK